MPDVYEVAQNSLVIRKFTILSGFPFVSWVVSGASARNAAVNSYAQSPAPSTNGSPLANVFNVSEIAQGFTQQLNAAINNGVPAVSNLLTGNPNNVLPSAATVINGLNSYSPDPRITRTVNEVGRVKSLCLEKFV
jgi:hypothetical protein